MRASVWLFATSGSEVEGEECKRVDLQHRLWKPSCFTYFNNCARVGYNALSSGSTSVCNIVDITIKNRQMFYVMTIHTPIPFSQEEIQNISLDARLLSH